MAELVIEHSGKTFVRIGHQDESGWLGPYINTSVNALTRALDAYLDLHGGDEDQDLKFYFVKLDSAGRPVSEYYVLADSYGAAANAALDQHIAGGHDEEISSCTVKEYAPVIFADGVV